MNLAMNLAMSRAKPQSELQHIMNHSYGITTIIYLTIAIGFCLLMARTRRGGQGGITHGVVAGVLHGAHALGGMAHGAVVGGVSGEGAGGMMDRAGVRRSPPRSMGFFVRAIHGLGEVGAIGFAYLVIAHESMWVGLPLAAIYAAAISASVYTTVTVWGVDETAADHDSFWHAIVGLSRNATIVATIVATIPIAIAFGTPGVGLLFAGVAAAIPVGISSRAALADALAVREKQKQPVAGAFGMSATAIESAVWNVDPIDGTVTMERSAALFDLTDLPRRVAEFLPHLQVGAVTASTIELVPVTAETIEARHRSAASGGMVSGTTAPASAPEQWSPAPVADPTVAHHVITAEDLQ